MALITQRPKGTQDTIPAEAYKWNTVESLARETAELYGFKEIRTPTFEQTSLFERSVGDTTDVVQKEMYTVTAKQSLKGDKDSSFTLRPEGTAGAARAIIENGIINEALPQKVYYLISCFRHEKPQAGRLREFHQFGVEMYGSSSPCADADVIALAKSYIDRLGLKGIELFINSIGCKTCRAKYHEALREYFESKKEELCETCKTRLEKNPMRILDCKSPICSGIAKDAPVILDFLCEECSDHFEALKANLNAMDIEFSINPKIVRGLDYYTKTVFEFITTSIGAQGTVCGGGRYDGLIEEIGGPKTPALGFAMGLERLILTMDSQGCDYIQPRSCNLFIATMGDKSLTKAVKMTKNLRDEGFWVEYDVMGRGLKAQMKYADKIKAEFSMVLGENELDTGKANLKNMATGEQTEISLDDRFVESFSNIQMANMLGSIL